MVYKNNFNNKKRYLELLEYAQKLKQKNLHISEVSEENFLELLNYSAATFTRLQLEFSPLYLNLLDDFLEIKISSGDLARGLFEIQEQIEKIQNILESNQVILLPHLKGDLVYEVLDELYWLLDDMAPENDVSLKPLIEAGKAGEALHKKSCQIFSSVRENYNQLKTVVEDCPTNVANFSHLVDQLNWENQNQFIDLIEQFLHEDSKDLLELKNKYESVLKVAEELQSNSISLKLNYRALGFSNWIQLLIQLFDSSISPKVFKSWVEIILLQMKNH